LGPTGACYQEWKNHGVRATVIKIKPRLATNNNFATFVVSVLNKCSLENIGFIDSGYIILYKGAARGGLKGLKPPP